MSNNIYVHTTSTSAVPTKPWCLVIHADGRVVEITLKESAIQEIKEQPYFNLRGRVV